MQILEHIDLATLTTFKIGGKARYFAVAKSVGDIQEVINFAKSKKVQIFILGGGSNLLISDAGFAGLVIKNEIIGIKYEINAKLAIINYQLANVGAGENWDTFVADTINRKLWGIENLSGVPGTVGATPIQNIGAYGQEVKDTVLSVDTIDLRTGKTRKFDNKECDFKYRDSFFKTEEGKNYCVTNVTFKLSTNGKPNLSYKDTGDFFRDNKNPSLEEIRRGVLHIRSLKFPDLKICGTAGSFWKNPIIPKDFYEKLKIQYPDLPFFTLHASRFTSNDVKVPLAYILDKICGLKGYKSGNVRLYEKQPLVVVSVDGATKEDVEALAKFVEQKVLSITGITVEREVHST